MNQPIPKWERNLRNQTVHGGCCWMCARISRRPRSRILKWLWRGSTGAGSIAAMRGGDRRGTPRIGSRRRRMRENCR